MKKTLATLCFAIIASVAARAEGYLPMVNKTFTNSYTYTNTFNSPRYIEFIDIQCLGITTNWTVILYNGHGITNTLVSQYITNQFSYTSSTDNDRRVEFNGWIKFTCDSAIVTNKVSIYPYLK